MRFKISLFIFCGIGVISGVSQAAPMRKIVPKGATNFTPKERSFAVWFPGKPVHDTVISFPNNPTRNTDYYGLKWPKSRHYTNPDAVRFVIDATPVPSDKSFSRPAARNHLKELVELYLLTHKVGSAFTGEIIEQSGFPGRDLRFLSKLNAQSQRMRLYQTAKWTYTISIYGSISAMQRQAAQINRVFDSFRILPQ